MTPLHQFLVADALTFSLAAYAWIADHRRQRRRDIDRVGMINWVTFFVFAILLMLFAIVLTLKEWLRS